MSYNMESARLKFRKNCKYFNVGGIKFFKKLIIITTFNKQPIKEL